MKILWTDWQLMRVNPDHLTKGSASAENELRRDLSATRTIVILGFLLGLAALGALWLKKLVADGFTILFWALACYALGVLAGFLFGIPRVLQNRSPGSPLSDRPAGKVTEIDGRYQILINTNLDDISDWLTKIIVGVGLIDLRKLPGLIYDLATLIAGDKGKADVPLIEAVVLYFGTVGLMAGYLTTRMFFQRAFRASDLSTEGIPDREIEPTAEPMRPVG